MSRTIVIDGVIFGLQKAGGISRLFAEFLQGLDAKLPHTDKIYLLLPKKSALNAEWKGILPHLKRVKLIKRKTFRWGKRSFYQDSLYLTLLALFLRPSHWHSSFYVGSPLIGCKKKIITFHDMIPEMTLTATPYERRMKKKALDRATKILSISEASKRDLLRFWPALSSKTVVVHNSAPQVALPKQPQPYLLFVGKREGYKNYHACMKALLADPRLNGYTIKVAGGESTLSLSDARIEWLGLVSRDHLEELIAYSTALLFPSLKEGFGIPLLEAFSLSTVVLAYKHPAIQEVVGDSYPLFSKEEEMAETLWTLVQERERWVEYGRQRALEFSFEKHFKKVLECYDAEI